MGLASKPSVPLVVVAAVITVFAFATISVLLL